MFMTKFNLKAGKYIISDPCYLFPKDEWHDFCGVINYGEGYQSVVGNCESIYPKKSKSEFELKYKGKSLYVIPTAYGDGCYALKQGRKTIGSLGVDAGLLSVIPLELAQSWPDFEKGEHCGIVIELKEDSILSCKGGDFKFGEFSVKTDCGIGKALLGHIRKNK